MNVDQKLTGMRVAGGSAAFLPNLASTYCRNCIINCARLSFVIGSLLFAKYYNN